MAERLLAVAVVLFVGALILFRVVDIKKNTLVVDGTKYMIVGFMQQQIQEKTYYTPIYKQEDK